MLAASVIIYVLLAVAVLTGTTSPLFAGWIAATWTWFAFLIAALRRQRGSGEQRWMTLVRDDLFWAGLLASTAIFMLFYFA